MHAGRPGLPRSCSSFPFGHPCVDAGRLCPCASRQCGVEDGRGQRHFGRGEMERASGKQTPVGRGCVDAGRLCPCASCCCRFVEGWGTHHSGGVGGGLGSGKQTPVGRGCRGHVAALRWTLIVPALMFRSFSPPCRLVLLGRCGWLGMRSVLRGRRRRGRPRLCRHRAL